VQPKCPAFMRSNMVSEEHAKHTHTNKQRKWKDYFPFGLSQELGVAFNYLDKQLRKRWAWCCGLNNWSFWTTFLWLLFVFMEKPSSSLFLERNQNGKNRLVLVIFKTLKNQRFSWKNQWFHDWLFLFFH